MTEQDRAPAREGQPLQLVEAASELIPYKCVWKCAGACYHEAPNEVNKAEALGEVIERRLSRRSLLGRAAAAAAVPFVLSATPMASALVGDSPLAPRRAEAAGPAGNGLGFRGLQPHVADALTVPEGYQWKVLLRWGDPLFPDTPRMTLDNVSPALQRKTFGYNCDLNVFFKLEGSRGGLLFVNHEYTEGPRMFHGYAAANATREQVDVELAGHGATVVELTRNGDDWGVKIDSKYNRRITGDMPIEIHGPLRGHDRMKTSADPTGTVVTGMLNNCAGGRTLWGTVLTGEENFNQYFANSDALPDSNPQKAINKRYGIPAKSSERRWENHYSRFDAAKEPNEVNRFGYLVEVNPFDPTSPVKKRTMLGRFKHEGQDMTLSRSNQVVLYSGDDERFDYLYKFVSKGTFDASKGVANGDLLDEGTLSVAKFYDDGTGEWLPLLPGVGALADWTLADILINTRGAADKVGATPMDRPEDVEINPMNNRVYMACTNNTSRTAARVDGPNPRPNNAAGHILELDAQGGDHGARRFSWSVFMLCGDPNDPSTYFAGYDKSQVSIIGAPDNVAFDGVGNLWISTDGAINAIKRNDSIFAVPTAGPDRGKLLAFANAPKGAEWCGPEFSYDYQALFANVQHPGENGKGANDPESVWPDNVWPALPSLVVITKANGGGRIGS